ncbi:MAG: squalene/phytoene synthase family protein [Acetobacteraceae bacterium]
MIGRGGLYGPPRAGSTLHDSALGATSWAMRSAPSPFLAPAVPRMNDQIAALVRRHDPDRFLTALFAPPEHRDALLTLYAFDHELGRARDVTSEPHLALIRLHWWREVVEGARRRHEVAGPLGELLDSGRLEPQDLLPIIDAHEIESEPCIESLTDWHAWLLAGAGGIAVAAGQLLGAADPEIFRPVGASFGAARVIRRNHALARRGRCLLPADLLAEFGLSVHAAIAAPESPNVASVLRRLAAEGQGFLAQAPLRRWPRAVLAAALPAVLSGRDLRREPTAHRGPRGLGDRVAVIWAGVTGRV